MIKAQLKQLFYILGISATLDKLLFKVAQIKNKKSNSKYAKANYNISFPPDYYLYETYQLNYQQYIEDGNLSAKEIIEWTIKYISISEINILEWGCGVSRTVRHINKYTSNNAQIFACDINDEMIRWNTKNIENVLFSKINYNPPTTYFSEQFNMIYAISVFTHIDVSQQENWAKEIHRILSKDGVFLFTTHGSKYVKKLLADEQKTLKTTGAFTKSYFQKGHRMMSTYNVANAYESMLKKYFSILEFYDGEKFPNKIGGQDLWIVKKI